MTTSPTVRREAKAYDSLKTTSPPVRAQRGECLSLPYDYLAPRARAERKMLMNTL